MARVRFYAAARAGAGIAEAVIAADNLAELIPLLTTGYPALADVLPRCSYLIDEVAVHGDPSAVLLDDRMTVDVLPPFAGGTGPQGSGAPRSGCRTA